MDIDPPESYTDAQIDTHFLRLAETFKGKQRASALARKARLMEIEARKHHNQALSDITTLTSELITI